MATLIVDFDSTLIRCESLEEVLKRKQLNPGTLQYISDITHQGMSGSLSFSDSLKTRLSIASIHRQDFMAFGEEAEFFLTPGFDTFIKKIMQKGVDVWIVSGAIRETLLPLGKKLGIDEAKILGVQLDWSPSGEFIGINDDFAINRTKWEGAKEAAKTWSFQTIAVGDGMTDYALYEHKLVDTFIAFTQNARREALINKVVTEARTVDELDKLTTKIFHGQSPSSQR